MIFNSITIYFPSLYKSVNRFLIVDDMMDVDMTITLSNKSYNSFFSILTKCFIAKRYCYTAYITASIVKNLISLFIVERTRVVPACKDYTISCKVRNYIGVIDSFDKLSELRMIGRFSFRTNSNLERLSRIDYSASNLFWI